MFRAIILRCIKDLARHNAQRLMRVDDNVGGHIVIIYYCTYAEVRLDCLNGGIIYKSRCSLSLSLSLSLSFAIIMNRVTIYNLLNVYVFFFEVIKQRIWIFHLKYSFL